MITIGFPKDNLPEREYIIDVIFGQFLGVDYQILPEANTKHWSVTLNNGNRLLFKDAFFSQHTDELSYLSESHLPQKIDYAVNQFLVEEDIPVLYGSTSCVIKRGQIDCGIDIFASSFFMLTRWEEHVNKRRDKHNRFSAKDSIAYKNNFLHRPIVNEYVEMLWNMLQHLGYEGKRKKRKYELMATHDVDVPLLFTSFMFFFRLFVSNIIKQKDIAYAFNLLKKYSLYKLGREKDPFDTFDFLMDVSEQANIKSYFFFMGEGKTEFDNCYHSSDAFITKLISKIKSRGHHIGMHPTYNAYNDGQQFSQEKQELEKNLKSDMMFGREHYLRFEVPTTWQIWEDNNMVWDSTLSYADKEGFRCGVCYEYRVFNILTRKMLKLKEKPLIVMECSAVGYQEENIAVEKVYNNITMLINKVRKYKGCFVFLWHNSSFNDKVWKKYQEIYKRVMCSK